MGQSVGDASIEVAHSGEVLQPWEQLFGGQWYVRRCHRHETFGVDPFSFTTDGVYWANHSWLLDLILYLLYQGLGGPAVVLLKALVLTAVSLVMLAVRRPGQSFWIPGAVTGLAVLAMSPRFLLLPGVVSYLFLALTLWLLFRPDRDTAESEAKASLFRPRQSSRRLPLAQCSPQPTASKPFRKFPSTSARNSSNAPTGCIIARQNCW